MSGLIADSRTMVDRARVGIAGLSTTSPCL